MDDNTLAKMMRDMPIPPHRRNLEKRIIAATAHDSNSLIYFFSIKPAFAMMLTLVFGTIVGWQTTSSGSLLHQSATDEIVNLDFLYEDNDII